ncbi:MULTISPECIES: sensor histidine kinase [unclassified Paenibacillus]|uniref:cache domain-containing sensor histidine kinase n=1 Tax=unclassified Paenibacillus TaxID=185978 RepID=UPI000CFC96E8|nr:MULTISPECIES: sensor histidine kinase [unclassified Paenibacillus]MBD8839016.1 sensor histidine kinase [Paenibacillus sp. CFBP 13594]PRA00792.1 histidine kinase [Paenibacillus sp. MYb63]PRA50511.1 histidine kinase [Paenibacillus sp. MYb67]QZN78556.1 sensor histidine kinase [Paenibacillus sp. DR312]
MPLRYQLMLLFLLFAIVPSVGLGLLVNWTVERVVERQVEGHTMQLIGKVNEALNSKMENLQNMTYLIAFEPDIDAFMNDKMPLNDDDADGEPINMGTIAETEQNRLYGIKQTLQGFTTLYPEIAGIVLVNASGDYISNEMYPRAEQSLIQENWYQEAAANPGIFMVLGQPKERNLTTHVRYKDDEIVSVARSITDEASGRVRGVIMIDLKLRSVSQAARNVTLGKSGYVMVTDAEGQSVYKPEHPLIEDIPTDWFPSGESGTFTAETEGGTLLFMYQSSTFTGWRTVGVFPTRDSISEVRQIQFYVVSFVFVVCLFGLSASSWFSRSIAQPIFRLMSYMRRAETGNLRPGRWSDRADEIGMLGNSYNRMLVQIRQLISLNELRERQKRDAEMRSLQEHIKPHFLYNTLDTIHWMARKEGAEDVSGMVGALSRLFRIGLSKGQDYIPLHSEIEHMTSYMQIQQTRYRDRLQYTLNVPEELRDLFVLKLLLQPLIENAIYHGIKGRRGPGHIRVEARLEHNRLLLTVQDNGAGMSNERLAEMQQLLEAPLASLEASTPGMTGKSYGMLNVQARLRLSFGDEYGIVLESQEGEGTNVTIIHPLMRELPTTKQISNEERQESEWENS